MERIWKILAEEYFYFLVWFTEIAKCTFFLIEALVTSCYQCMKAMTILFEKINSRAKIMCTGFRLPIRPIETDLLSKLLHKAEIKESLKTRRSPRRVCLIASLHAALRTSLGTAVLLWARCSAYIACHRPITSALFGVSSVNKKTNRIR